MLLATLLAANIVAVQPPSTREVFPLPATREIRYCFARAEIPRAPDGRIKRSSVVRDSFQRQHPCPSNGATQGPCPGWEVDHVIPLGCGGCDSVNNMQWLPIAIKKTPGGKDRWERRMYCR